MNVEWFRVLTVRGKPSDAIGATCAQCSTTVQFHQSPYRFNHCGGTSEYTPPAPKNWWERLWQTDDLLRRQPFAARTQSPVTWIQPAWDGITRPAHDTEEINDPTAGLILGPPL
jgi:hypothetical protein